MQLIAFARLSQYGDGKTGIDTQDEDDRKWAADNGHEIIQMVADHISGSVSLKDRKNAGKWLTVPGLITMYDGILVSKIDRLTRHRDWDMRQWAEEHGKKIIIVNPELIWPPEPGDIATPVIWDNLVYIAASEWTETSKRWKRMQKSKRDQKSFVGKPPYGYRIAKIDGTNLKTLEPDPETAPVVRSMFEMYDKGMSIYQIIDSLNEKGISVPQSAKGWQHNVVRRILQNPSTVGRIRYKGATVLRVPPLVPLEDYNRVSALIKIRATRGPGRKDSALLTGMVFCNNGSPMYRQRARNDYFYYCHHGCPAGSRLMVKMSYLDSVVDDMVMSAGDEPHMITVVTPGDDHGHEIDQIREEIRDLDPEANDYDSRLAELRDELKNLRTLPSTPRKIERKPSGKTIGELWQSLDAGGKRRFLQNDGAKFHVSRDADRNVHVVIGPDPVTLEGGELYRSIVSLGGPDYPATYTAAAEAMRAEQPR
jgi:DNA invertase Pin-like site-specific DNA recombinase